MRRGELKVWIEAWDQTPVIRAEGEVDLGTVDAFRQAVSEVVCQQPASVIFDLRQVTFMDSSGLGILMSTRKRVGADRSSVLVVTRQPTLLSSLSITGLDRYLLVAPEPPVAASLSTGGVPGADQDSQGGVGLT